MLAIDGSLACGTMSNLFLVEKDVLSTPPIATGCRAGVTREVLFELAAREGLEVRETLVEPAALWQADEVFFASTRVECLPVSKVDGKSIGRETGHPRTSALRARLRELVASEASSA